MKKIIALLLFSASVFAQDSTFTFTQKGFTDYVVTPVPGKLQNDLYKKAIDWVAVTYKNPKEVMKAQIENDYIRIEGVKEGLVAGFMGATFPIKYLIEISFKDARYKFDVISIEYLVSATQYAPGGWRNYEVTNVQDHYKSNGDLKSKYANEHTTFPNYFNQLNKELQTFLKSESIPSKKSEW